MTGQHPWGITYAYDGRYAEAEVAFLSAVEMEPEMAGSYGELGLVYDCRGEYARMLEALRRAAATCDAGVRAYLGERPLVDVPPAQLSDAIGRAPEGAGGGRDATALPLDSAVSHPAEGCDTEAARVLELIGGQPECPPAALAVPALSYLLRGNEVAATGGGYSARGGACSRDG